MISIRFNVKVSLAGIGNLIVYSFTYYGFINRLLSAIISRHVLSANGWRF